MIQNAPRSLIKAAEDKLLGAAFLVLSLPLLALAALLIKLFSPGPVFFRQARNGLHGRTFTVLKLRTMHGGHVTPVGRFLRATSIDELPQLFNVLRGEMSLVGPRPHPVHLDAVYQDSVEELTLRQSVKPGITGLAQVSGCRGRIGDAEDMRRRLDHDLTYIRTWSLRLDLWILAVTLCKEFLYLEGSRKAPALAQDEAPPRRGTSSSAGAFHPHPVPSMASPDISIDLWRCWTIGRRLSRCMDNALFVVGAGRSGTTVLCEALGRHSNLLIARGEGPVVHRFGVIAYQYSRGEKSKYYWENTALDEPSVRESIRRLCFSYVWGGHPWLGTIPSRRRIRDPRETCRKPIRIWGVKAFPDQHASQGLVWLYPSAKFIYIYRNGVDVVRSMGAFPAFRSMNFEERCRFWSERVFRYDYLRGDPGAVAVRFEDFVDRPAEICDTVFKHLGLDGEEAPSLFASSTLIHPLGEPTRAASPKSIFAEREPAYVSWTLAERQIFLRICKPAMELLGYNIPF